MRGLRLEAAGLAVSCTFVIACLDEWHQSFLPSRTGTFRDAILDGTAGLVAQIALFAILRKQRLRMEKFR